MRREFIVSVEMPDGCSVERMVGYIADAVGSWKGGLDPEDPAFELDYKKVRVRRVPKPAKRRG